MRFLRCLVYAAAIVLLIGTAPVTAQTPQQAPPGQEEFVPLSEIPPEEQIPAFTLVAAAYAAVWIVLIGYVWSVSRRLQTVESELTTLSRKRT
jgi:CcmD family protein